MKIKVSNYLWNALIYTSFTKPQSIFLKCLLEYPLDNVHTLFSLVEIKYQLQRSVTKWIAFIPIETSKTKKYFKISCWLKQ